MPIYYTVNTYKQLINVKVNSYLKQNNTTMKCQTSKDPLLSTKRSQMELAQHKYKFQYERKKL